MKNLIRIAFDHSPLIFHWEDGIKGGLNPCRYEIMRESHPEFKDHIQERWNIKIDGTIFGNNLDLLSY